MKRAAIFLIFLTLSGGIFSPKARGADSLYDARSAGRVAQKSQFNFGPLSSHFRYDKRMIRAAEIAAARARRHSTERCWRYVKDALVVAKVVGARPETAYAKQAGDELTKKFGFRRLKVNDPFKAPLGSVLVYGGRGAGHVELRTRLGFVSDFVSETPSPRPLLGVYVKPT